VPFSRALKFAWFAGETAAVWVVSVVDGVELPLNQDRTAFSRFAIGLFVTAFDTSPTTVVTAFSALCTAFQTM